MAGGKSQGDGGKGSRSAAAERERLVAAFGKVASEHGYRALTVDQVARYAGVTAAQFEQHLGSKERGLIVAQDAYLKRLLLDVTDACHAVGEWPAKVEAGIGGLISSLTETSALARVFTIEAGTASFAALERQATALDGFADLLSRGREIYPRASGLPPTTERILVGGIAAIIVAHLLAEEPQSLVAMKPELVELTLIPYLGPAEARRMARG